LSASKVKKNQLIKLTGFLKDGITKVALKNKELGLYEITGKKWKLLGAIRTSNAGAFTAYFRPQKNTTYIVTWIPNKGDRAEYIGASILPLNISVK